MIIAKQTVGLFTCVNPVVVVANGSDDDNSGLATDVALFYVVFGEDSGEVWAYVINSEGEFEEKARYEVPGFCV